MSFKFRVNFLLLVSLLSALDTVLALSHGSRREVRYHKYNSKRATSGDRSSRRRAFLHKVILPPHLIAATAVAIPASLAIPDASADVGNILSAGLKNSQITYSSNAKNLNRINSGDLSGGSKYSTDPGAMSPAAAKRRAMLGCKIDTIRKITGVEDEKECNVRVMGDGGGRSNFIQEVLDVMVKLDCPTCPNGIDTSKTL